MVGLDHTSIILRERRCQEEGKLFFVWMQIQGVYGVTYIKIRTLLRVQVLVMQAYLSCVKLLRNIYCRGKLWSEIPHTTADNYFMAEELCDWGGPKGLWFLGTVARNRLPHGIDGDRIDDKYFHKDQTSGKKNARLARYCKPIIMVQEREDYQKVHFTFQSTGSTNLLSCNSILNGEKYGRPKYRGRGQDKRTRLIDMNMARDLYLNTYGAVDKVDAFIARANMSYRHWKYYHAPCNHAKALALHTAYSSYSECVTGELDPEWKIEKPMSFHQFQQQLGKQMIEYHDANHSHAGDDALRQATKSTKLRRGKPENTESNKKKQSKKRKNLMVVDKRTGEK
mmetsp:Transcript_20774/g.25748  ORF Transcript_20774/g.25748 Transcript_20774/m.25748 type:complete len:339 (-) Transcript_20774:291-1307(-)